MAYRKLGRDNKHRRSMLATLTKQVIVNESITTTETRAKEVRKFLHNDKKIVDKIFHDLAKRYENRNGGYTQILKLTERRGDDSLMVIIKLVEEAEKQKEEKTTKTAKKDKEEVEA